MDRLDELQAKWRKWKEWQHAPADHSRGLYDSPTKWGRPFEFDDYFEIEDLAWLLERVGELEAENERLQRNEAKLKAECRRLSGYAAEDEYEDESYEAWHERSLNESLGLENSIHPQSE